MSKRGAGGGREVTGYQPQPPAERPDDTPSTLGKLVSRIDDLDSWRNERRTDEMVDVRGREDIASVTERVTVTESDIQQLESDLDVLTDRVQTLEQNYISLQTDLTNRIQALETWRTGTIDPNWAALIALIGHVHNWDSITLKPTAFPPATHDNGAHTPDYSAEGHTHNYLTNTDYNALVGFINDKTGTGHTHDYEDSGVKRTTEHANNT